MINDNKGATLYFAIIIMSVMMAAVFSIGSIVLVQIRAIKGMGDSVVAYYAADTGAEIALDDLYKGTYVGHYVPTSLNGSSYTYEVWVTQPLSEPLGDYPSETSVEPSADCQAQYYCIKSVGTYNNVRRAVEVSG